MRRRTFITLLGGAASWPLAALAQQAKPLCRQLDVEKIHTGQIAAGPGEVRHQTVLDRVFGGRENDRHCRRRGQSRECPDRVARCGDESHAATKEVSHQLRNQVASTSCPAVFDHDVLTFYVA